MLFGAKVGTDLLEHEEETHFNKKARNWVNIHPRYCSQNIQSCPCTRILIKILHDNRTGECDLTEDVLGNVEIHYETNDNDPCKTALFLGLHTDEVRNQS